MIQTNLGGVARKAAGMLAVCSLVMVGAITQPVQANQHQTPCVGILTGSFDSVVVPEGQTCRLFNSFVAENVTALDNSRLLAEDNNVGGSIRGHKHNLLFALGNTVGENIHLQQGTGAGPDPFFGSQFDHVVRGNTLPTGNISVQQNVGNVALNFNTLKDGNIQVEQNVTQATDQLQVRFNSVTGDVDVRGNAGNGAKAVQNNVVSDRLRCEDNDLPFTGTPNTAGEFRGQCGP